MEVVARRRAALSVVGIGDIWCAVDALGAHGAGAVVGNDLRRLCAVATGVLLLGTDISSSSNSCRGRLALAAAHADVTTDADTAALLGDGARQNGRLGKSRELLGAVDCKFVGLDLHAPVEGLSRMGGAVVGLLVEVGKLLRLLEQVEGEAVESLVADRQIGEQEVASLLGTIEVGHAGDRHTSQDRRRGGRRRLQTAMGEDAGMLECGEQEEVCVVGESDVLGVLHGRALEDTKLHNRGRVDRTAVSRGFGTGTASAGTLGLLDNLEMVPETTSTAGDAVNDDRLRVAGSDGRGTHCGE